MASPRLCNNCGQHDSVARERCRRCYNYRAKMGRERPLGAIVRSYERDEAMAIVRRMLSSS